MDQSVQSHSVQCTIRYEDCRRVYRHHDLPSEVETGELGGAHGGECGVVTAAVQRGREGGRKRGEGGRKRGEGGRKRGEGGRKRGEGGREREGGRGRVNEVSPTQQSRKTLRKIVYTQQDVRHIPTDLRYHKHTCLQAMLLLRV